MPQSQSFNEGGNIRSHYPNGRHYSQPMRPRFNTLALRETIFVSKSEVWSLGKSPIKVDVLDSLLKESGYHDDEFLKSGFAYGFRIPYSCTHGL